jgi:protein involved in polysaccharide export with SLBB domain
MSRRSSTRVSATLAASVLLITFAAIAGPQDRPPGKPHDDQRKEGDEKGKEKQKPGRLPAGAVSVEDARKIIDRMIAEFVLTPRPQSAIPDNPPPHEGAVIDIPLIVEPPDLIIVEVLEALPGRPISGERLVKPDGTINLGFYGEVHVRGLTLPQVKVTIIKHLRKFLDDEILGLAISEGEESPFPMEGVAPPAQPVHPEGTVNPFEERDKRKAAGPAGKPRASLDSPHLRGATLRTGGRAVTVRHVRRRTRPQETGDKTPAEKNANPVILPGPGQGQVKITIDVQGQNTGVVVPNVPAIEQNAPSQTDSGELGPVKVVHPVDSDRVFVDITAYNSKNYFVVGDVQIPGKLPSTGNETVLDAIQYAGGLMPTAEPKDIRLVRPGRNGKPARVYPVDLEAIQEKGDVRTNYQLFPGDRLVVGRNEVVKKTVELDRLQAPIESIVSSIHRNVNMLKAVGALTPEQSDRVLKDLVDFWAKEVSRKGDLKFDEQTLREILQRHLKPAPANPRLAPSPGAR